MRLQLFVLLLLATAHLAAEEPQWMKIGTESAGCFVVRQDGELLVFGPNHAFRATGGYTGWDTLSAFETIDFTEVAVTPQGKLVASSWRGVWLSADGGESWQPMGPDTDLPYVSTQDVYIDEHGHIYICGENFSFGDGHALWRSRDNGASWKRVGTNVYYNAGALALHQDGALVVGTDAGIFNSYDKGETFERVLNMGPSMGARVYDMEAHAGGYVLAGLRDLQKIETGLWRSDTGATHYTRVPNMEQTYVLGTDSLYRAYAFSETGADVPPYYGVYRSLDSGRTWSRFSEGIPAEAHTMFDMITTPDGYVYIGGFGVFRTVQRTSTAPAFWGKRQLCNAVEFVVMDSVVSSVELVQSQSDNVKLEVLSPPGTAKVKIRLELLDVQKPGHYTLRALNAVGAEKVYSDTLQRIFPRTEIQRRGDTLWAGGGYVYQWYRNNEKLDDEKREYIVPQESGSYSVQVLNAYGCEARSEAVEYVPVSVAGNTEETTRLEQNTPNPFSEETLIGYTLGRGGHVRLVVSDVTGRTLGVLVDRVQEAGRYTIPLSATGLASGVYRYHIELNGVVVGRRTAVLK